MNRKFDLLTAPIAPGAATTMITNLPWSGCKMASIVVAKEVAADFKFDSKVMKDGQFQFTAENVGKRTVRFAAVVTLATEEKTEQKLIDHASTWPPLVEE